jgi:hypothetical protein
VEGNALVTVLRKSHGYLVGNVFTAPSDDVRQLDALSHRFAIQLRQPFALHVQINPAGWMQPSDDRHQLRVVHQQNGVAAKVPQPAAHLDGISEITPQRCESRHGRTNTESTQERARRVRTFIDGGVHTGGRVDVSDPLMMCASLVQRAAMICQNECFVTSTRATSRHLIDPDRKGAALHGWIHPIKRLSDESYAHFDRTLSERGRR